MRYAIAAIVSALILAGGAGWCRHTRQSFWDMMRADFERAKAAGDLPPEQQNLSFDEVREQGFGTELPGIMVMKLSIADLFQIYWFVFVILICGVSFGIAHWMSPKAPQQESQR